MKLTKKQREALKQKFGGFCAYCGCKLGERWQADHIQAVQRSVQGHWVRQDPSKRWSPMVFKRTGVTVGRPELDILDNLAPACGPCNGDKSDMDLETWRHRLSQTLTVLGNNYGRYKDALRFGLIVETPKPIEFHFERWQRTPRRQLKEDTL